MTEEFDSHSYQNADHARTYRQVSPGPERQSPEIDADYESLMRDGYVIIKNLLTTKQCAQIKSESERLLGDTGRNSFEGLKTQRVYNVLGKTRLTDRLADHPRILGLLDKLF